MSPALVSRSTVDIIDIRSSDAPFSAEQAIHDGLNPPEGGARSFPTVLLYDTKGLQLFEEITYLEEYYLTNAEIELLTAHAKTIAERLPDNAQLVELGSGNLRKIEILLQEVERMQKRVDYFALDLSLEELERTFAEVSPQRYQYVRLHALHGTYDDAMDWLHMPENRQQPTWVLSLGSSLGNFNRPDAAAFLNRFARLLGPSDALIIGLDGCTDRDRIFKAYNDSKGITHEFYRNGLVHANAVLGQEAFKPDEWAVHCIYDDAQGCHQAFYVPTRDVTIQGNRLHRGEQIIFEEAYKYDRRQREQLWRNAGLIPVAAYGNSSANDYHLHMLSSASLDLPTKASEYAAHPVPTVGEWKSLWTAWDIASKSMVPREELLSKPIKLRNALIFYLGHIPTFLDIHLTRATRGKPTDPKAYQLVFERGIDPDVDDPEQCHSHSEIPDEWPRLDEILDYQERVRARLQSILETEKLQTNRLLSEAVWIGFEHEIMHLETFLYMLLQSDQTLPPLGVEKPDFKAIALEARKNSTRNQWFSVPQQTFTVGLDDSDLSRLPAESFGWDNEKPQRVVTVPAFEAQGRPVTNGEYAQYLEANGIHQAPASWVASASTPSNGVSNGHHAANGESNGHDVGSRYAVRTVFGPVPLEWAADWPVMASYDELAAYAKWMNCRLPTFEEARSIYRYSSALRGSKTESNGVLSVAGGHQSGVYNSDINGVKGEVRTDREWNPCRPRSPDHQPVKAPSLPSGPVFTDLDDGGGNKNHSSYNVGFQHWHPIPVTPFGDSLAGQGGLGGVWEWTSTPLEKQEGFEAMEIYPGYTADFFDGKHNIVLGGSWATHPRIAGRTTFVNWYQHNYLYAWTGARLVRDI